jgi:2-C-methyl-D-erythritol 2,4-cyclodiphosphate synthase
MRIGFGYDVHAFAEGRELWLGGIKIDYPLGLLGHSDADVLIHAICDALLGAANMRDIGYHFPDSSSQFKNIDSKILLCETMTLLRNASYELGNIDATIVAEQPKLSSYIPEMQKTLSETMQTPENNISIKATTTEKLGFTGRKEGIAAYVAVLIERVKKRIS